MKTLFTRFSKKCLIAAFVLASGSSFAATFTAVSSGSWSSSATWAGGTAPGGSIGTLDNVIINSGVTVTMDMDVEFSGILTGMEVNGTLTSTGNDFLLDMNGGTLSGTGTLTLNSLRFGTTAAMTFSGTANVDNLWNNSVTLNIASDMDINDTLFLDAGTFNLAAGGDLTFVAGSVIRVDDGTMTVTSGALTNTNDYSVHYVGTDKSTGMELAGTGLTDVWVELDDNSQELAITGNVTIHGMLHHNAGAIDLNGGTLTLMSDYESMAGAEFMGSATSNLRLENDTELSSAIVFDSANDELNDLMINNGDSDGGVELGSNLTINGTLWLEDGDLTSTSGALTMAAGSEIVVGDGHLANNGGSFDGTAAYNVTYNGDAPTWSTIELTGSGLNDLTIDMANQSDSVELMQSVTIDGALNLEQGGIATNGYDMTLEGSLSTSSMAWLAGHPDSDLTFNTNSLIGDTIWFHTGNYYFGDITINADDNSDLMLASEAWVDNITMTSGGIHLVDNKLWVIYPGTITGANEDRYVTIDGTGSLLMQMQPSDPYVWFPVGTDDGYAPVALKINSGAAGYFKVGTSNGVWEDGDSGENWAMTGAVVDRTWDITANNAGALDYDIMLMWSEDFEVNGFDRTDAYIMSYANDEWDADMQTPGTATQVGDMWQLERQNVITEGPFAVRDGSVTGIDENVVVAEIYPNPVQDVLNANAAFGEATTLDLVDVAGNVLHTETLNGTVNQQIDFSAYPNGVYFLNYTNSKGTSSYRVVKTM